MEPQTDRERKIAETVDATARTIHNSADSWDDGAMERMRQDVPFEMTAEEWEFFKQYVGWRREHPSG